MATIKRELSPSTKHGGKAQIYLRISLGRGIQPRVKSGLYIAPARFKDGAIIKPRANQTEAAELRQLEATLTALEQTLLNVCTSTPKDQLTKDYLNKVAARHLHPENYTDEEAAAPDIYTLIAEYMRHKDVKEERAAHFACILRTMQYFENYKALSGTPFAFDLNTTTAAELEEFKNFLSTKHEIYKAHPEIFPLFEDKAGRMRKPQITPQGTNATANTFKALRAFWNWSNAQGYTNNRPFVKFEVVRERYGTPYYLTTEERDQIAAADFSKWPGLEAQRDIFIFHCYVGCRVSDLMRLTPANIINGGLEYIATKTKGERPDTIRVPLHPVAAAIVAKYAGRVKDGRLLPFTIKVAYNLAIKSIFSNAGITRPVTILNPVTREEEQRPINEVASSHIARRTFIGNLYKKVKDPNLIGRLSGHKEGSKAFARYRDIDEDMKKDVINLL